MRQLHYEIILKIQYILIECGELRAYANICKAFNWEIDISHFEKELLKYRRDNIIPDDTYDEKNINFWKRTGIDDGIPEEFLKKHLNDKTKLYKTILATYKCSNKFFKMRQWMDDPNMNYKYITKYASNILVDNRKIDKIKKCRKGKCHEPCDKCKNDYINEIENSKQNNIILHDNWKYRKMYRKLPDIYSTFSIMHYTINTLFN